MWTSDPQLSLLRLVLLACVGALAACLSLAVSSVPKVAPPALGLRGLRRAQARAAAGALLVLEPVLASISGLVRLMPLSAVRVFASRYITRAGEAAGLCADELIGLSLLFMAAALLLGGWFVLQTGSDPWLLMLLAVAGLSAPLLRLDALARERAKALERSLPSAIDLCVLCMGAGADFPSALGFASRELGLGHDVCREELEILLEQLKLGRTRVEALEDLSQRTGSATVQQFVAAVCQSETKGTPLVDTLTIQSSTLRQRRSVIAEEMAARAGVRMILPLMLMLGSVLLLIFAPFLIHGVDL